VGVNVFMERILSAEERIRRAEEIYYKRQNQGVRVSTASVNLGKEPKVSLGKKMCIQIIICVCIYSFFYILKSYNTIFSNNVITTTKTVLSYDINLEKVYKDCVEYFNNNFNNIIPTGVNNNGQIDSESQNSLDSQTGIENENNENYKKNIENENNNGNSEMNLEGENSQINSENNNNENSQVDEQNNDGTVNNETPGIGGGSDVVEQNVSENKSQMELDAEYVKQNYSLIIPVQGRVTSSYGNREPTEIITAFHQGIDIGAVTGTIINASMEGTVIAASYAGDYGNHIKIQNGDILTVYAHCSELNVSVGDYVCQGQQIGKVGATGKVTGPHLHFEIRKENRFIDPSLILEF